MKFKSPYKAFPFYCLRTPTRSVQLYNSITESYEITDACFKKLFEDDFFIKALTLASPELVKQFGYWQNNKIENSKKIEQIKLSILKYLTRITTRATPFGLFANCVEGSFSNDTEIELKGLSSYKTFTRLDMSFLSALIDRISKLNGVKNKIQYVVNSSLYKVGNQYRYIGYIYNDNNRIYYLDGALYSDYLEIILSEAIRGKTLDDFASLLISKDIDKTEALSFINELVEKQILVSELQIIITNSNNLSFLIEQLELLSIPKKHLKSIKELNNKIKILDTKKPNNYYEFYNWIENEFKETKHIKKHILQVDLFASAYKNTLNKNHIKSIRQSMIILNKITLFQKNSKIENFKIAFKKRYETRELPLYEVLDTEIGIGYSHSLDDNNPLLENIHLPNKSTQSKNIKWTTVDSILLEKITNCLSNQKYTLKLNENDFKDLGCEWNDLPDTMASMIEVVIIDNVERLVFNWLGGSSAANILARFSHGHAKIFKQVEEITQVEKKMNPNKVLSEIIHLPQSRTGNILRRPSVRDYEIPFLGKSGLPYKNQIPISDIMISVKNNKIVLRSKRLDIEILPRLTNAHNYANALPIYYFLCDMQYQDKRNGIGFQWHPILENLSFLPRVEHNSVIFSKAQWNIKTENIVKYFQLDNDDLVEKMRIWRTAIQMPELVQLVEGDNLLLINMKNATSIRMLFKTIKNLKLFKLKEFLFDKESVVKQNSNSFCNQFIVSLYNEEKLNKIQGGK
ncbi:lantibiotic dehydratase family protein [uncultured Winogradskyella sp.]|uniref:lantibiotic dehydratase family protein n=1 Tax=uncultured Winogradskyella sp. TaxID=395353 RepID=UPI0026070BE7|nr:lantibiotic dehydratase family protein [uncultured Winogradskyella sp.]